LFKRLATCNFLTLLSNWETRIYFSLLKLDILILHNKETNCFPVCVRVHRQNGLQPTLPTTTTTTRRRASSSSLPSSRSEFSHERFPKSGPRRKRANFRPRVGPSSFQWHVAAFQPGNNTTDDHALRSRSNGCDWIPRVRRPLEICHRLAKHVSVLRSRQLGQHRFQRTKTGPDDVWLPS